MANVLDCAIVLGRADKGELIDVMDMPKGVECHVVKEYNRWVILYVCGTHHNVPAVVSHYDNLGCPLLWRDLDGYGPDEMFYSSVEPNLGQSMNLERSLRDNSGIGFTCL